MGIQYPGASLGANTFTGAQAATSLALGGASLGGNALAVTGTAAFSATVTGTNIYVTGYVGHATRGIIRFPTATDGLFQFTLNDGTTGYSLLASADTMTLRNRANSAAGALVAGAGTFSGNITIPNGGTLQSVSQGQVSFSGADAQWLFRNNAATTGFTLDWATDNVVKLLSRAGAATTILDFGTGSNAGIRWGTSSLGLFNNSNNVLAVRSAANNSDASITAAAGTFSSYVQVSGTYLWNSAGRFTAQSDGVLTLFDAATTSFGRLQFGGTTSSFPAIKRSGAGLQVVLADDSGYAQIYALDLVASNRVIFGNQSRLLSPSDGVIGLYNSTQTDFSRLQFGGTTSSFPAIARNGTSLDSKLADNSGYCAMTLHSLLITDNTNILRSTASMANGAGVSVGTLTNAPAAGNPTKWFAFNDNGTTRYIPAW